jgi:hypothetical protein
MDPFKFLGALILVPFCLFGIVVAVGLVVESGSPMGIFVFFSLLIAMFMKK